MSGQNTDSLINRLTDYAYTVDNFLKYIPREKVYLHLDNTSYYQGDDIWFKCYITNSGLEQPVELSKTLYVELLNPGGELLDKRILKIEDGQCHGDFTLNQLPFYSGFYEIRAYTKYMLNFGEDAIFSRLLPVFDRPRRKGDFDGKRMQKYGTGNYPMGREKPLKGKKLNLKFFPEGGNLVQGVASQVAFEATDASGNPMEINGMIVNKEKEEVSGFSTVHNGRGVFTYVPSERGEKAVVEYNGKKYQFDLPPALSEGFVLTVDNISSTDSIGIVLQRNKNTPAGILGLAVFCRNGLQGFYLLDISGDEAVCFNVDKTKLPAGVSQIVLFDDSGKKLSERLVFVNKDEYLNIRLENEKDDYQPYELVDMKFSMTNQFENPFQVPFSLSVRDGEDEVEYNHNILTELLLTSDIKGYVHNPSYYFESDDSLHRKALDLLLMVQGWRRYSWEQAIGTEPFKLKYSPEQGIEVQGKVVSFVLGLPKPGVEVSSFLLKRGEEEKDAVDLIKFFVTDSLGRFSFVSDVYGKWNMILSVSKKNKKKDYRIILDRLFAPKPRRYPLAEMQVRIADTEKAESEQMVKIDSLEKNVEEIHSVYEDSLNSVSIDKKVHQLDEVIVTAEKNSKENEIYENRSKSIAYYDVHSELDDIKDRGKYVGDDIHELLLNINKNFSFVEGRYILYKGKTPLFVINYRTTADTEIGNNNYKTIGLDAIKSIYINEDLSAICKYADPKYSPLELSSMYRCVVFIETYPEGKIPAKAGKGIRKTWLDGYSEVKEFYSPDYSQLPSEKDYRRTLYWNPSVFPDAEGKVNVHFYNNSRCRKFKISAETVSSQGLIGVYRNPE